MSAGDPPLDELWERLSPHLTWPEGFSLVLLFAGHPGPVEALRRRLEQQLEEGGRLLDLLEPGSSAEIEALLDRVVTSPRVDEAGRWVSLIQRAGTPGWNEAVADLVQRLNERRFLLERDLGIPLVLVLPVALRLQMHRLAPDLWTIRSFSDGVSSIRMSASTGFLDREPLSRPAVASDSAGAAEIEWTRLIGLDDPNRIDVVDGLRAFDSAWDRGDIEMAHKYARQALDVALSQAGVSLGALDDLDVASSFLRTRNIVVCLRLVGRAEAHRGALRRAHSTLELASRLSTRCTEQFPGDPLFERELMVSLAELGDLDLRSNDSSLARDHYQQALEIAERLLDTTTPAYGALHDLMISHTKVGDSELEIGRLPRARDHFLRALELGEQLLRDRTDDLSVRRSMCFSRERLGFLETRAGNLPSARKLFTKNIEETEAIVELEPWRASSVLDLVESLLDLSEVAAQQEALEEQQSMLQRARAHLDELSTRQGPPNTIEFQELQARLLDRLERLTPTHKATS